MTHVAGINVSVFQNSKHKDAALAFVKFLPRPAEQVSAQQGVRQPAGVRPAQDDQAF